MLGPLQRASEEVDISKKMLKAKTEEEIREVAPALGALAEVLNVSSIDILLAEDQRAFIQEAMERSTVTVAEIRDHMLEASSSAREEMKLLGFGDNL